MININISSYIELAFFSFVFVLIVSVVKFFFKKLIGKFGDDRISYKTYNTVRFGLNILMLITLFLLWGERLGNLVFFISFLSLGAIIILRNLLFNWICGKYIIKYKPFCVGDRVEVDNLLGDVTTISTFNFEISEISNKDDFGQYTGKIVSVPNSYYFTKVFKNCTKNSKYIWNEIDVDVPVDADTSKIKKLLYDYINEIDIIKNISKRVKQENPSSYSRNFDPVIYMKVEKSKVVLSIRYLIDPKKSRYISSIFWNKICEAYKRGDILLYKGNE